MCKDHHQFGFTLLLEAKHLYFSLIQIILSVVTMRVLLIVAASLGVAYAGVGTLSPAEEANIINMFQQLCSGVGSEGRVINGVTVYCKKGSGESNHRQTHQVTVRPPSGSAQAVYVQPPPANYEHEVVITQQAGEGDRTKIYVLPQVVNNRITPRIIPAPAGQQTKPVVYFLNGGNGNGKSGSSSSSGFNSNSAQIQGEYNIPSSLQPIQNSYGTPQFI